MASQPLDKQALDLAAVLEQQTLSYSVVRHAKELPAFQELLREKDGVRCALSRLGHGASPVWLIFLQQATGENPAQGTETISDSVSKWLAWGEELDLI